jgi:prepilin-type processing-associated H-X9-DG protein
MRTKWQVLLIAGIALLVTALAWDVSRMLLLGWALFLLRVVPELKPDGPTVAVSAGAVLLFTIGLHWLAQWWLRYTQPEGQRWKLRWSLGITALLFLMFAAGTAMIGIVHQTGWVLASPEGMYHDEPKFYAEYPSYQNLRELGLGLHNYNDTYQKLPAAGTFSNDGTALHGWEFETLIYLSVSTKGIDPKVPWNDPRNAEYFKSVIPNFINPALHGAPVYDGNGFALSHYSANSHIFRANQSLRFSDITDGTSNTIMFGEINANFPPWGRPMNVRDPATGINRSPNGFGGPRSQRGANFAMADGSVHFISENVGPNVMRALATPNAGDTVDESVLQSPRR